MKIGTLMGALAIAIVIVSFPGATMTQAADDYVNGQVTKIDPSAGKITIKHGPLKQFDMDEGMTMVFRAGDPEILKSVKPGDKIRFVAQRINGQFTATKVERVK